MVFTTTYNAVKCNLTELTAKSTCVPLEVSGVDTYAHVSEFHVLVDRRVAYMQEAYNNSGDVPNTSKFLARYSKTRWQTFDYAHSYSSAFSLGITTSTGKSTRRAKNCVLIVFVHAYARVEIVLSTVMLVLVRSNNGIHFTGGLRS